MISVIIATKNGEKYIARAIGNALQQSVATESGFEIVAVSDGSTDNTVHIVKEIIITDSRVRLIELTKNIGPGLARNVAILGEPKPGNGSENSDIPPIENKYVAILDDDDLWQNTRKLENQIKYLEEHPDTALVGSKKTEFIRENGEHLRWITNQTDSNIIRDHMLSYNPVITSSAVFRSSVFAEVGGFKAMYLAEDYDLWLRMGLHGNISNAEDAETTYTIRDGGASKSRQIEMAWVVLSLAKEYRHLYPNAFRAILKGYARIARVYWKVIRKGKNPFA